MHKLVVRPLREHLYRLFVEEYTESGAIQLLAENIKYARTKTPKDIGIRVSEDFFSNYYFVILLTIF